MYFAYLYWLYLCYFFYVDDIVIAEEQVQIGASSDVIAQWFRNLEMFPENYKFNTHQDLRLISGNWGEISSIIQTSERIGIFQLFLQFTFISVDKYEFSLSSNDYPIIINFSMYDSILNIQLVGTGWGKLFLVAKSQIARQLSFEVNNIQRNIDLDI